MITGHTQCAVITAQPNGNLEATVVGTCFLLHGQSLSTGEFQVH